MANSSSKPAYAVRLKKLREHLGYGSQPPFANFLDVPLPTYQHLENGRSKLNQMLLEAVAHKLGAETVYWLLTGDGGSRTGFNCKHKPNPR